jgi:hypothetical protein
MKKATKREMVTAATDRINEAVKAGRMEDVQLEDLLLLMPGGKAREALFVAVRALQSTPGMRMDTLLEIACRESILNSSTGGWVVGREWGDYKGFGPLDLLFDRRKERHEGDARSVWHYYLLPPGRMLAECPIDPRQHVIDANLTGVAKAPKPGGLLIEHLMVSNKMDNSDHHYAYPRHKYSGGGLPGGLDPAGHLILGYCARVNRCLPVSWSDRPIWQEAIIEASGPDSPNWKEVVRSRNMYLSCMGGGEEVGGKLAIYMGDVSGIKIEAEDD